MALFNMGVEAFILLSLPVTLYWVYRYKQGDINIEPYTDQYEDAVDYDIQEQPSAIEPLRSRPNAGLIARISNPRNMPNVSPATTPVVTPTFLDGIKSIFRFVTTIVVVVAIIGLAVYAVYAIGNKLPEPMNSMLISGDSEALFRGTVFIGLLVAVMAHFRIANSKYTHGRSMFKWFLFGAIYVPLFGALNNIGAWIITSMYKMFTISIISMSALSVVGAEYEELSNLLVQPPSYDEDPRAVGKNILTMAGFYETCVQKSIVENLSGAIARDRIHGENVLNIVGADREANEWFINGTKGILIEDPTKSENTFEAEFTKEGCTAIKSIVDAKYQLYILATQQRQDSD